MRDEFLWVEKYRPKTIEECILPPSIKKTFQDFLDKGEIPNMLLAGPASNRLGTSPLSRKSWKVFLILVGKIQSSIVLGRYFSTQRNSSRIIIPKDEQIHEKQCQLLSTAVSYILHLFQV